MSGWGTSPYGVTPWGGGSGTSLSILSAIATATNTVLVTLSEPPMAQSTTALDDALNPATWFVKRNDTGGSFPVVSVAQQANPAQIAVTVYGNFADYTVLHTVSAPDLQAPDGAFIGSSDSAVFPGIISQAVSSPAALAASQLQVPIDISNPPFGGPSGGGTIRIGSDGDYARDSGTALIEKLIIRRITTQPGAFYHLGPTYGVGLDVKSVVPTGDLVKLKATITAQCLLEPDVASVTVSITMGSDYMIVQINGVDTNGQQFSVTFPSADNQNLAA